MPNKRYFIDVLVPEGLMTRVTLETNSSQLEYPIDIFVKDNDSLTDKKVEKMSPSAAQSKIINSSPVEGGVLEGVYFKVQLEAIETYVQSDTKYQSAQGQGILIAEPIANASLQRILIGNFREKTDAIEVAKKMRSSGQFPQAFVVKYHNGKRIN
jgi:hypothetical protein